MAIWHDLFAPSFLGSCVVTVGMSPSQQCSIGAASCSAYRDELGEFSGCSACLQPLAHTCAVSRLQARRLQARRLIDRHAAVCAVHACQCPGRNPLPRCLRCRHNCIWQRCEHLELRQRWVEHLELEWQEQVEQVELGAGCISGWFEYMAMEQSSLGG